MGVPISFALRPLTRPDALPGPIALMAALVVPQLACGLPAGRHRYVEDEP